MKVGIVGYGVYIPRNRIKVEEIAKVWGADAEAIKRGLMLEEKSVPALDQDTITISVEAARAALKMAGIDPKAVGAIYIGSESHPYAVKPSGTVVAEALNITPDVHTVDYEFACKAGTEAIFVCFSLVKSGLIRYGLGIGTDTSQGAPGDALEYTAAAGGAAFLIGGEDNLVAEIEETYSYTTDCPDFWRREGQFYPKHGGRFTGQPAYFKHIVSAAKGIMDKANLGPEAFKYVVFHQPNGKFPLTVGKMLGFKKEQIEPGRVVPRLGNTYSGSSPIGLAAVLDIAKPEERILMVSYGSGAGSDAFIFKVADGIKKAKKTRDNPRTTVREMLEHRIYIDYGTYAKYRGKILMNR